MFVFGICWIVVEANELSLISLGFSPYVLNFYTKEGWGRDERDDSLLTWKWQLPYIYNFGACPFPSSRIERAMESDEFLEPSIDPLTQNVGLPKYC